MRDSDKDLCGECWRPVAVRGRRTIFRLDMGSSPRFYPHVYLVTRSDRFHERCWAKREREWVEDEREWAKQHGETASDPVPDPVRDLACEACGHTVRAIKPWGRCHLYCDETCWVTGPVNDRREARREKKPAELKRRKAARTGDRKRHPRHGLSRARGSPPTWGAYRGSDDGGHGTARRATRPGT